MRRRRRITDEHWLPQRGVALGVGVLVMGAAVLLAAVPAAEGRQASHGESGSANESERALERGASPAPVVTPEGSANAQGGTGASLGDSRVGGVARAQLLREGSFIRERRGRLVTVDGIWLFVFDPDKQGEAEPPMPIEPCTRLMEMQRIVQQRAHTLTFEVSGMIFVYRARNYLLPTYFVTVDVSERAPSTTDESAAEAPEGVGADPSVGELLRNVRRGERDEARMPRPAARIGGGGMRSGDSALLREGLTLISRVGRVHADRDGRWVFAMDNGPSTAGGDDAPLTLSPCLNLMEIERVLDQYGHQVRFSLSGTVFVYEGANYLIPTLYRIEMDREGNTIAAH